MAVFRTLVSRRRGRHNIFLICTILIYILWVEFFALHFKALFWRIPKRTDNSASLLLVADPQLIGYKNEHDLLGWLTRWDSDRYMKRAFEKAFKQANPDYVVFLGDLVDEGVEMQFYPEQFKWTLDRFYSIFPIGNKTNQIYIAGDNDIGGEREGVFPDLKQRFDKSFPNVLNANKASKMLGFSEVNLFEDTYVQKLSDSDGLKILLSHMPVIRSIGSFEETFGNYRPDLILSAHDHTAEFYVKKPRLQQFSRHEASKGLKFSVSTGMPLVEIQVPTISYRMGVPDMAIGILSVDSVPHSRAFTISYDNLWLPGRYPQLYGYLFLGLFSFLYSFGAIFRPIWKKIDRFYRKICRWNSIQIYRPV